MPWVRTNVNYYDDYYLNGYVTSTTGGWGGFAAFSSYNSESYRVYYNTTDDLYKWTAYNCSVISSVVGISYTIDGGAASWNGQYLTNGTYKVFRGSYAYGYPSVTSLWIMATDRVGYGFQAGYPLWYNTAAADGSGSYSIAGTYLPANAATGNHIVAGVPIVGWTSPTPYGIYTATGGASGTKTFGSHALQGGGYFVETPGYKYNGENVYVSSGNSSTSYRGYQLWYGSGNWHITEVQYALGVIPLRSTHHVCSTKVGTYVNVNTPSESGLPNSFNVADAGYTTTVASGFPTGELHLDYADGKYRAVRQKGINSFSYIYPNAAFIPYDNSPYVSFEYPIWNGN